MILTRHCYVQNSNTQYDFASPDQINPFNDVISIQTIPTKNRKLCKLLYITYAVGNINYFCLKFYTFESLKKLAKMDGSRKRHVLNF